ncbi:MAG: anthrone oxygenase family protein [Gammaproteobacteria bacterium]
MTRESMTRAFLWVSVTAWGIGLGAKIFDLLVLATAWGASPPRSFDLLPYGKQFPIDPGTFFQPLSFFILLGSLGALMSSWKTPKTYRNWLWLAAGSLILIWILTPTVFWPMINELWDTHRDRIVRNEGQSIALVHRWMLFDSLRVAVIAVGFFSSVKAISLPYPAELDAGPSS